VRTTSAILVVTLISEKQVKEARDKAIKLINDAKWFLIIPENTKYDSETLLTICKNWEQAFDKIEQAKKVILEVTCQTWAESVPLKF